MKKTYDFSFPNCPELKVHHKYLIEENFGQGWEEARVFLMTADKRGIVPGKWDFIKANSGYDFAYLDKDAVSFKKYFSYGETWRVVKELPDSETGEFDYSVGRMEG